MWISHIAVQLLSHAWLSGTSRTVACQASFFTMSGVCLNSYPLSQWYIIYHSHISPPSRTSLPSHQTTPLGHHSATGWAPCLQPPPTSYLYYKWQCIYCNATLPIYLTPSPSLNSNGCWERYPSEVSSTPLMLSLQSLLHCTSCFEHLYDYPSVRR